MLYIKCVQCRHPISAGQSGMQCRHLILAFQQMYARSPPGPTWKSLKLDWASSISDLSIFEWAHERKLTQTTPWIFSELLQGQAYMYMQCRHGPPTSTNIYAMSPPEPCVAKSACKVATFLFLMEGDMQCRHVTPVISIQRNQIPLRCQRNLKITLDCLIFCMQCRHAIPLVNWTVYAMSPCGWPKKWYAVSPCDPVCQQYTLCNVAPHPFTGMHICNVAA